MPVREFISWHLAANQFRRLAISFEHVTLVETLPLHHRDPFDRLLIAQAMTEDLDVISADTAFDQYKIRRKWR